MATFCPLTISTGTVRNCSEKCAWRIGESCAMAKAAVTLGELTEAVKKIPNDTDSVATTLQALAIVNEYALGIATKDEAARTINNL